MIKYKIILGVFTLFASVITFAQEDSLNSADDLMDMLEANEEPTTNYTIATFKNTTLISGQSVETNGEGVLQFLIGHRFGRVNAGIKELMGLDNATIRLGFCYGITDRINIGFGRSSFQKTYDGTFKWKLLRQKSGAENFPFTATWVSSMFAEGNTWANPDRTNYFSSRLSYYHSLLLARKFGDYLSLQVMPAVVHRNLVPTVNDKNTLVSLGTGMSVKMTGSLRLNAEYLYILPNQIVSLVGGEKVRNTFSIGVDLETGGHVFQLHFSNSRGMTERYLIGETTGNWFDGGIHFGFNVSRVFTVKSKK